MKMDLRIVMDRRTDRPPPPRHAAARPTVLSPRAIVVPSWDRDPTLTPSLSLSLSPSLVAVRDRDKEAAAQPTTTRHLRRRHRRLTPPPPPCGHQSLTTAHFFTLVKNPSMRYHYVGIFIHPEAHLITQMMPSILGGTANRGALRSPDCVVSDEFSPVRGFDVPFDGVGDWDPSAIPPPDGEMISLETSLAQSNRKEAPSTPKPSRLSMN
ncbi:hypothetical protein NL676_034800 [Syzygium grande]|nr:hypothetical protein NL676_034800 [Syzygium grande]